MGGGRGLDPGKPPIQAPSTASPFDLRLGEARIRVGGHIGCKKGLAAFPVGGSPAPLTGWGMGLKPWLGPVGRSGSECSQAGLLGEFRWLILSQPAPQTPDCWAWPCPLGEWMALVPLSGPVAPPFTCPAAASHFFLGGRELWWGWSNPRKSPYAEGRTEWLTLPRKQIQMPWLSMAHSSMTSQVGLYLLWLSQDDNCSQLTDTTGINGSRSWTW